ncbi:F-box protein, partial [Trifolium medium]|nr:F-box protein [Trifolium medium]
GPFDFHSTRKRLLTILNGSIAFILNYEEKATFHIYILGELGVKESWTKLFIVGPLPCLEYPIRAGKKGNILIRIKDNKLAWSYIFPSVGPRPLMVLMAIKWLPENGWRTMMSSKCSSFRCTPVTIRKSIVTLARRGLLRAIPYWALLDGLVSNSSVVGLLGLIQNTLHST